MEYAKLTFQPKVHSDWGASGYHRWSVSRGGCPASVRHIRENAPPELLIDDEVKDDGIEAHGISEVWLKERDPMLRAVLKAKAANNGGDFTMLNLVHKYVTYVDELATLPQAELLVEQSFDLSWLADGLFGTTDAIVYAPFSDYYDLETQTMHKGPTLHVIDLKYGFQEVDAEENVQALYYALGAYAHYHSLGKQVNRVVVHIWQPRVIGRKNAAVRWSCDASYLESFALQLKEDKLATDDPEAPFVASLDNCRLCKGRTTCPELMKPAWKAARMQIMSQGGNPEKTLPTIEQAKDDPGALYMVACLAIKWAESTRDRTRAEMQQGKKLDGLKLIKGRGGRAFNDLQAVQDLLPRSEWPELYNSPDLKSTAQVLEELDGMDEKEFQDATGLTRAEFEAKYVIKTNGAPLVALASDPKPEWNTAERARSEWADELIKPPAPPPPPPPAVTYDPPAAVYAPPPPPPVVAEAVAFDPAAFFNK